MQVRYETTEASLVAFNAFHSRHSPSIRRMVLLGQYGLPVFLVVICWPTFAASSIYLGLLCLSPFILAWIMIYPKWWRYEQRRRISKMVKEGGPSKMFVWHTITLDQNGISEKTTTEDNFVHWSGVERFAEDDEYLYIYISALTAHVIPKRAFESKELLGQFVGEAKAHLSSAAA
jgi:hypothetical protein